MPASPDVQNYHIGKGIVSFQEEGSTGFVDLGNAPSFVYEPATEKLEHFSAREGVKTKDFTAITQVSATIEMTLDEITEQTLSMFTLGTVTDDGVGNITIDAMSKIEFVGDIKVVGTNAIGQQVDFTGKVSLVPSGNFSFITSEDDFSVITIKAEIQKGDDGDFGKFTIRDTPAAREAAKQKERQARRDAEQAKHREPVDHG